MISGIAFAAATDKMSGGGGDWKGRTTGGTTGMAREWTQSCKPKDAEDAFKTCVKDTPANKDTTCKDNFSTAMQAAGCTAPDSVQRGMLTQKAAAEKLADCKAKAEGE